MQKCSSLVEKFSCCSLWQECQKAGRCVQKGNSVVSRGEYLRNCSMAKRYQPAPPETQVKESQVEESGLEFKAFKGVEQLSLFD